MNGFDSHIAPQLKSRLGRNAGLFSLSLLALAEHNPPISQLNKTKTHSFARPLLALDNHL